MSKGFDAQLMLPPNHRSRVTSFLSDQKAIDLVKAAAHAMRLGQPLNRFITINFTRALVVTRAQDSLGRLLKIAGQWLGDRGVELTYIWVIEEACGTGLHAHILIHCPNHLQRSFTDRTRHRWLQLAGIDPNRGVCHSKRVGYGRFDGSGASSAEWAHYRNSLRGLMRYLLKGMDPNSRSFLDAHLPYDLRRSTAELLKVKPAFCSPIQGRRCSRSQNIGFAARRRLESQ